MATRHPGAFDPRVMLSAKSAAPRKLEATRTKHGQEPGLVTYEVSADGETFTA